MKSLFTLFILLTGILTTNLLAQPWNYDFGTATGSFNTGKNISGFLPNPLSGSDQVRVGNAGGGFVLNNPGSDSELQITASNGASSGSINKFSVYNYTSGTSFSIGFNIRFDVAASDNGVAYFFIGDGDYFTNNIRYVGTDLYTGIRWTKGEGDGFLQMAILSALGGNYDDIGPSLDLNTEYYVEMFGNNTAGELTYDYPASTTQTLSAYSYDIWIDGFITTVTNRLRSSNTMGDGASIDSYMILAENSTTSNKLVVIVDDFTYSNALVTGPLPVELTSFTASVNNNQVLLKWETETEVNNYGFDIERTKDSSDWLTIGFVEGHGNSNSPKQYSFTDKNPVGGSNYSYRLKQIDTDGKFEYSDVVEVLLVPNEFFLSQNFPNPFNPSTTISYQILTKSYVQLFIYDALGNKVAQLINEEKESGTYEVEIDGANLTSGIYFYQMNAGDFIQTKKMILLK